VKIGFSSRLFLCVVFILVSGFYSSLTAGSFFNLKEKREEQARAILEDVAVWFIREGLSEYYKGKDLTFIEKTIRQRGAYLSTETSIDKYGYIAKLVPEDYWVTSTVICYSRVFADQIYEYWVIDRFSGTREDVDREIYFLIAKTGGLDKPRVIIHRSSKFFPKYAVSKETLIYFPMDNESIFELSPWYYPEAFKGTELEGITVVIENEKYIRKKLK